MEKEGVATLAEPEQSARDVLTEIVRNGARDLLASAVEAEVAEFLGEYQQLQDENGRQRVVRNGYLPSRQIQTGIGAVEVHVPRVRDRSAANDTRIRFSSRIIPPYLRRSRSLEEFLPYLYLKGISTGDFQDALRAILGPDAPGLSPATICRLKQGWTEEYERWRCRDLSDKAYIYVWADGVYLEARTEERQCILVLIGATEDGRKELVAIEGGYRESEQSWRELLVSLKEHGLNLAPKLAIGDGALGFWKALSKIYGTTRHQRCWFHKTGNVLNKLPKSAHGKAKQALHDIWMAESREAAEKAFDDFVETYHAKFADAVTCLTKDRDELLAFYDFPAEHWKHIRTTNPIESTFATVELRTGKTRGCLSRQTALTMVFQL
jgi:transposase-like protein